LIILAFAVISAVAVIFLVLKYERHAEASSIPSVAAIERVDGQVGLNLSLDTGNKDNKQH